MSGRQHIAVFLRSRTGFRKHFSANKKNQGLLGMKDNAQPCYEYKTTSSYRTVNLASISYARATCAPVLVMISHTDDSRGAGFSPSNQLRIARSAKALVTCKGRYPLGDTKSSYPTLSMPPTCVVKQFPHRNICVLYISLPRESNCAVPLHFRRSAFERSVTSFEGDY